MDMMIKREHGGLIPQPAGCSETSQRRIIDFSASINPLGPVEGVQGLIKEGVRDLISNYPDPDARVLKEALASYHGISPENIMTGNGSTHLIYLIARAIRPERTLVIEPAFSEYSNALYLSGAEVESFILTENDDFVLDKKRLLDAISHDMVFLANPSSPRDALLGLDMVREIAGYTEERGIWLVIDEAFMDFCEPHSFKRDVFKCERVIVLRSMTKFFSLAGLRIGYVIASKGVIDLLDLYREPWSVNSIAQIAGVESLKDRGFREKTLSWIDEERGFLFDALDSIKGIKVYPGAANFLLVKILEKDINSPGLKDMLFAMGIVIRDCSSFVGLDDRFFRVSILKRDDNMRLIDALREIFC